MRKRSCGDCRRIRPPAGSHGNVRQRVRPTPAPLRPGCSGQSTISTQLSTLETRLGYRLCERGRSGFRLTARGERFVDSARKLLGALDVFSAEARKVGRTLVGT
ncbi:LysR family transcriptional regulator, partial [Azoarcus indigens]|nr:LysR family transcriptional regulator [Azoarcus indigens]